MFVSEHKAAAPRCRVREWGRCGRGGEGEEVLVVVEVVEVVERVELNGMGGVELVQVEVRGWKGERITMEWGRG